MEDPVAQKFNLNPEIHQDFINKPGLKDAVSNFVKSPSINMAKEILDLLSAAHTHESSSRLKTTVMSKVDSLKQSLESILNSASRIQKSYNLIISDVQSILKKQDLIIENKMGGVQLKPKVELIPTWKSGILDVPIPGQAQDAPPYISDFTLNDGTKCTLLAVADGAGGSGTHNAILETFDSRGEVSLQTYSQAYFASREAIASLEILSTNRFFIDAIIKQDAKAIQKMLLKEYLGRISKYTVVESRLKGSISVPFPTTLSFALISRKLDGSNEATIFSVGDSPAFVLKKDSSIIPINYSAATGDDVMGSKGTLNGKESFTKFNLVNVAVDEQDKILLASDWIAKRPGATSVAALEQITKGTFDFEKYPGENDDATVAWSGV